MDENSQQTTMATLAAIDPLAEIQELKQKVDNATLPIELKEKIDRMLVRLTRMTQLGSYSQEFESVEQYIRWVMDIPWGVFSKDNLDMKNAEEKLNAHHYGLQQVKDLILEYLAVMKLKTEGMPAAVSQQPQVSNQPAQVQVTGDPAAAIMPAQVITQEPTPASQALPPVAKVEEVGEMSRLQGSSSHAPILCFIGIQGVGKTSIAKSIATALNRPFVRVALGAMGNVSQIRGVARTEPTAEPGQIIKALVRAGSMSPIILLDEIDKTSSASGLRADLMAALLEILDPEQNSTFVDHYLDHPVDLSRVLFITTANNLGGISAALLDRLEVIRFTSYSDEDKINIARNYMLKKVREATGITEQQLSFDDDVWPMVVRPLGFDAGVRQLERTLTVLARKVAKRIVDGVGTSFRITKDNFHEFIPEDIGVYS